MGIEPTNGGTTILCLNHLATLAIAFPIIAGVDQLATRKGARFNKIRSFSEELWKFCGECIILILARCS